VLDQDELVVEGHNRPDAFSAPFFEQPEVRSFALLHIEQLEQAGREFDSRAIGPIF